MRSLHRLVAVPALGADKPKPSDQAGVIRGLVEAVDSLGEGIGRVDEFLLDEVEELVRLIRVKLNDPPLMEAGARLIPVEAVCRITEQQVIVNCARAHVQAGPADHRQVRDQRYLETVYAHYGYYPYWGPGYVYPSYPVYR